MEAGRINRSFIVNNQESLISPDVSDDFREHLEKALNVKDEEELKKVCQDIEQLFLGMMYKQMKMTVPKSDLFPDDTSRKIFDSMLDDVLMEEASKSNTFGLGNMLYKQLSKQQGISASDAGTAERKITFEKRV